MRNRHVAPLAAAVPSLNLLGGGWPLVAVAAAAAVGEALDDPRRARGWMELALLVAVTVAELALDLSDAAAPWVRWWVEATAEVAAVVVGEVPRPGRAELALAAVAVALHAGDVGGTTWLVVVGPHMEGAPVAQLAIDAGLGAAGVLGAAVSLATLKAAVLAAAGAAWAAWPSAFGVDPTPWRAAVPAVAAARGAWLCWGHLTTAGVAPL